MAEIPPNAPKLLGAPPTNRWPQQWQLEPSLLHGAGSKLGRLGVKCACHMKRVACHMSREPTASLARPRTAERKTTPESCGKGLLATRSRKIPPESPTTASGAPKLLHRCAKAVENMLREPRFGPSSIQFGLSLPTLGQIAGLGLGRKLVPQRAARGPPNRAPRKDRRRLTKFRQDPSLERPFQRLLRGLP